MRGDINEGYGAMHKGRHWVHDDCARIALKTKIYRSGVTVKATVSPAFLLPMSGFKLFLDQSHTLCTFILRISVCALNVEYVTSSFHCFSLYQSSVYSFNNMYYKSKLVFLV
jgi:hypothetical protein